MTSKIMSTSNTQHQGTEKHHPSLTSHTTATPRSRGLPGSPQGGSPSKMGQSQGKQPALKATCTQLLTWNSYSKEWTKCSASVNPQIPLHLITFPKLHLLFKSSFLPLYLYFLQPHRRTVWGITTILPNTVLGMSPRRV